MAVTVNVTYRLCSTMAQPLYWFFVRAYVPVPTLPRSRQPQYYIICGHFDFQKSNAYGNAVLD